jgi:hypothetical protein
MLRSIQFSLFFLAVDLTIYFLMYFLVAVAWKGFPFLEAAKDGGWPVVARIIYLQALFQLALIFAIHQFDMHSNVVVVVLTCLVAFFIPSLYFAREITAFFSYFMIIYEHKLLGPGLALLGSSLFAWIILLNFSTKARQLAQ